MEKTLAKLRSEMNLSQRELAKKLNISYGSVGMYEAGLRTPPLKKARKIAEFFGVPTDDIKFGKDDNEVLSNNQATI